MVQHRNDNKRTAKPKPEKGANPAGDNPEHDDHENAGGKRNHGGAREKSGRKGNSATAHGQMANSTLKFLERILIAQNGKAWKMETDERKDMHSALKEIFISWEVTGTSNPYAALIIASATYCYGKEDRLTPEKTTTGISGIWGRWKQRRQDKKDAAEKADEENEPPGV